jgi:transcriptional regulator with XRE-family HTH domain
MKLVKYDAMCRAIDAAYQVDEVKDIRDKAIALETYARLAQNVEAERQACEIRLRAERKAGKLSAEMERRQGRYSSHDGENTKSEILANAGVTRKQAEMWEKLAAVPQRDFEAALAGYTAMPTTAGIIRANAAPRATPVSHEALWLWGRLGDFERQLLNKLPADVMETLTDEMRDDVHRRAPLVAAWLRRIGGTSNGK